MTAVASRLVLALMVAASLSACAASLRNPRIADLHDNPGRYQHHSVSIDGIVTTAWSVPMVPYSLYKVDDGTGEVTVVSQNSRVPSRGAHVRVRGRVDDLAVLGGQSLGLHLREERLYVER
jgi:hypothetical protein